ncbi:hypothetical protein FCL47_08690 [Desulfopila sp. IMCC35006]|uniref:hypothetical protein n=1 Tax=Desulfopila sp. IMCC35006 TaxID=2569542 RepID=UPI0010AC4966|nr:hypothetical protein [Desulfopila sp. IMCC35006]TKB26481.1 hypothetical protein FCL47_08690 [Desulfopila sp. IMCC35006]
MFGPAEMVKGDLQGQEKIKMVAVLQSLTDITRQTCPQYEIGAGQVPFARLVNFLVVLNPDLIHLVVDDKTIGGVPEHIYWDRRLQTPVLPLDAVVNWSAQEFGFKKPLGISLPLAVLNDDNVQRRAIITSIARQLCEQFAQRALIHRLQLPKGYEHFSRYLPTFLADYPDIDNNIFLMMRFRGGDQYTEIHSAIKSELSKFGLRVLRADDKDYTGDLWENVCLYMLGSRYGVAVFEEIDLREFNPNVALELGFMTAQSKRCLLLKDQRMPKLPTDIVGKLYKEFDTYNITKTVTPAVQKWCTDIGLSLLKH